jgi:hypothetical protein
MPGRWYSGLFEIATTQNGFITTDDARALRGTPQVLIDMHRHGHLDRVGHGLCPLRRAAPPVYEVHVRDLDRGDVTRFEGIPVVTPSRAILDGVERHLGRRLIDQAIETARDRGLVTRYELAALEAVD